MGLISDRVIVVTGASRGAGKGIALALAGPGTTIYVTGRTRNEGDAPLPGTVQATAAEVDRRGGVGVAVYCDHADDAQVAALFERVRREHGRLDIPMSVCVPAMSPVGTPRRCWSPTARG